jgi:hypothetical protein
VGVGRAVVVDEDERRLAANVELAPDRAVVVDRVGECVDAEVVDEVVDGVEVVATGDADEGDVVTVGGVDLCDRRGFGAATRSPRCPEPQQGVGPFERAEVDLAAVGRRHHAGVGC